MFLVSLFLVTATEMEVMGVRIGLVVVGEVITKVTTATTTKMTMMMITTTKKTATTKSSSYRPAAAPVSGETSDPHLNGSLPNSRQAT